MTRVARLPGTDMFEAIEQRADDLRRRRGEAIKAAIRRREAADHAMEQATKARDHAFQERTCAEQDLRRLMEKGERVVIGDSLITLNQHGGILVEPVKVLGLV